MYVCLILKIRHITVMRIRGFQVMTIKITAFGNHFLINSTYICHITGKGKVIRVRVTYGTI